VSAPGEVRSEERRRSSDAARACVFAILGWFNNEDPFWSSFVPEPELTEIKNGSFGIALRGDGVRLEVRGIMIGDMDSPEQVRPSIVVGARSNDGQSPPQTWYPISCSLGPQDRFVTFNFRHAVEAALADARVKRA
jgi:hypothetical protein